MGGINVDLIGLLGTPFAHLPAQPGLSGHLTSPVRTEGRTHVQAPAIGIGFVDHGDGIVATIHVHCDATEDIGRFVVGAHVVHVSYRADEQGLSLVTLMSREVAPAPPSS